MSKLLKNDAFWFIFLSVAITSTVYAVNADHGAIVAKTVYQTFADILDIIVAVSIFIGLFQVWVKPATIVKLLGKESGYKGVALVCVFPIMMGALFLRSSRCSRFCETRAPAWAPSRPSLQPGGERPRCSRWRLRSWAGVSPCCASALWCSSPF